MLWKLRFAPLLNKGGMPTSRGRSRSAFGIPVPDTFKSSPYINNRHNHTAAYRMCSGGQQRWKGVGGDDGEQASKQACLTERFHLEATRRKVLTYVPSAKK